MIPALKQSASLQVNIINYYKKITDMSLKNLKEGKNFQFRRFLNNQSLRIVQKEHFEQYQIGKNSEKLLNKFYKDMDNIHKLTQKEYNKVLNKLKNTNDEMLRQKILSDYARTGATCFKARNGARWNLETYTNMYTTHVNNMLIRNEVIENDEFEYFQVSSHDTICPLCIPYEGRVLSREELDMSTLFHPNCQHYVRGIKANEYL